MRVAFRCDDRPHSGLGHVMRCATLSEELVGRGHEAVFVPRGPLPECDLIIVDSYEFGPREFKVWAEIAPLAVIDDLGDRDLRAATVIINQNFGADRLNYHPLEQRLLLGPHFALIRTQFARARMREGRTFSAADNRVLLTLGGGPVAADLRRILGALERVERRLDICVLGVDEALPSRHMVRTIVRTEEIANIMFESDVCISGGGVTALELACVGTPAIIVTLAPNQEPGAAALEEDDLAVVAGSLPSAVGRLAADVETLLSSADRRRALSERLMHAVDGSGTLRVAAALETILSSLRFRS